MRFGGINQIHVNQTGNKKTTSDSVPVLYRLDHKVSFNLAPSDGLGWVTHVHRYVH